MKAAAKPGPPGVRNYIHRYKGQLGRTVAVDPSVIPLGSEMYIIFPEEYSHLTEFILRKTPVLLSKAIKLIYFSEKTNLANP